MPDAYSGMIFVSAANSKNVVVPGADSINVVLCGANSLKVVLSGADSCKIVVSGEVMLGFPSETNIMFVACSESEILSMLDSEVEDMSWVNSGANIIFCIGFEVKLLSGINLEFRIMYGVNSDVMPDFDFVVNMSGVDSFPKIVSDDIMSRRKSLFSLMSDVDPDLRSAMDFVAEARRRVVREPGVLCAVFAEVSVMFCVVFEAELSSDGDSAKTITVSIEDAVAFLICCVVSDCEDAFKVHAETDAIVGLKSEGNIASGLDCDVDCEARVILVIDSEADIMS